jgi:hypothetical protein
MIVLNFAHPLTAKHQEQLATLVGSPPERILEVKVQFDLNQPFASQTAALLDSVPLSPTEWQTEQVLIVLPSLNYIAGVLLAELHGRTGHFPAILRLKSVAGGVLTEFEVAEIINLESIRQAARTKR